jgi:cell division septation protein DedD
MGSRTAQQGRGLSVRQLTFIFFGSVGVCAIFFALGYMMGANRRAAVATPAVEQVLPSGPAPPPVDSPLQAPGPEGSNSSSQGSAAVIEQNLKEASQTQPPARAPAPLTAAPNTPQAADAAANSVAPRAPAAATPDSVSPMQRGIMVQVAALRTKQDARSLLKILQSRGYPAVIVTPEQAHAGDSLYRVQVGPFKSRAEAVKTLHKLGNQGFRPFIRE